MKAKIFGLAFAAGTLLVLQSCGGSAEAEVTEDKEVKLDPLVAVDSVQIKTFIHEIKVQGNVETDKDIIINAEMGGLITSINVKEGQKVSKGTVIATVDAAVLASNLVELQTQLDYAEYMLKKQEELNKKGVGSEFDLETAKSQVNALKTKMKSLNTQQGKASIRAPFTGVIDRVFAKRGQMAGPQSPIVRLVNNDNVDIVASISEKHLSKIKVGTPIRVSFPNYGDTVIELSVSNVGNYIEPTNRTFRVMAKVTKNSLLLPNMLAEVHITDMKVENGTVIKSASVLKDQNNKDFIYVVTKDKKIKKINVTVIEKFEGETLIESNDGITSGTLIVIKGAKGVVEDQVVRID